MNRQQVKRTIAALTVSAAAVTGAGAFTGTGVAADAVTDARAVKAPEDRWAQELVSTFTERYARALKTGDSKETTHLRNSYFIAREAMQLQELQAMDGLDPIYKDYGLPTTERFEIVRHTPGTITVNYQARTTKNQSHVWDFQVDVESARIQNMTHR